MKKTHAVVLSAALAAALAGGCGGGAPREERDEGRVRQEAAGARPARAPRVNMKTVELFDVVELQVPENWGSRRTAWWADASDPQAAFIRVTRILSQNVKSEVEKVREDAGEFKPASLGGKQAMLLEGEASEPGAAGKIPFRKYFLIDRLPPFGSMLSVRIAGTDMEKHKDGLEAVLASFKIGDTIAPDAMTDEVWQDIPYRRPAAWSGGGGATERGRWFSFADPFAGAEYGIMLSLNFDFKPEQLDRWPWAEGKYRKIGNRWESGDGVVDNAGRPYRRQFYNLESGGKKFQMSCWVNGAYDFGDMKKVMDALKSSLNIQD